MCVMFASWGFGSLMLFGSSRCPEAAAPIPGGEQVAVRRGAALVVVALFALGAAG